LNLGHFGCFTIIPCSFGESRLLVSWRAGGRCGMACSDEDRGRHRRPGAEDRGWSHRSGTRWPADREVRWCRVWSVSCMWRRGARVSWLSLKNKVNNLSVVWPQNRWCTVSLVWPRNRQRRFLRFGLKTGGDVFLVEPQNQGGGGFLIWASKSPRRFLGLFLKTMQVLVCRLLHKTDGRMRRCGTRVKI
jgi:hypothetical protein